MWGGMSKDLGDQLSELADAVVTESLRPDVPLDIRLDALKTLTSFYAAFSKHKPKEAAKAPVGFAKFKTDIASTRGKR